jgi:nucleoside-diphosphate-sugar epimerase
MPRILITGGTGCIGSITICKLLQYAGIDEIVVATQSRNTSTMRLWQGRKLDPRIELLHLDLSDYEEIRKVVTVVNPTHIIHLGGLQIPDCAAQHLRGLEINMGATMALLDEAEKLPELERFIFASSGAVYGTRSQYPEDTIKENVLLTPPNHYGVWKLACEHLLRLFHYNTGVPSICLRFNTTYGPGRNKGLTSVTTAAMRAVADGAARNKIIPYVMPYCGFEFYHYVEDVGEHFAAVTMEPFEGYGCFNIKGHTANTSDFLDIIREQAEILDLGQFVDLSFAPDAQPILFAHDLNHDEIEYAFPNLTLTPLEEGINKSLYIFRNTVAYKI